MPTIIKGDQITVDGLGSEGSGSNPVVDTLTVNGNATIGGAVNFGGGIGALAMKELDRVSGAYASRRAVFQASQGSSNRYPLFAVVTTQNADCMSVFGFVPGINSIVKIYGTGSLTYDSNTGLYTLDAGTDSSWGKYFIIGYPSNLRGISQPSS